MQIVLRAVKISIIRCTLIKQTTTKHNENVFKKWHTTCFSLSLWGKIVTQVRL